MCLRLSARQLEPRRQFGLQPLRRVGPLPELRRAKCRRPAQETAAASPEKTPAASSTRSALDPVAGFAGGKIFGRTFSARAAVIVDLSPAARQVNANSAEFERLCVTLAS